MKNFFLLSFLVSSLCYSQTDLVGVSRELSNPNGSYELKLVTNPEPAGPYQIPLSVIPFYPNSPLNNSTIRWTYTDAVAIGDRCDASGNGLYEVVGYGLNNERISPYGNTNNTPLWEYSTAHGVGYYYNNVAMSDSGNYIAASSYHNIYIFNRASSTPIFNFDLTTLPDVGSGSAIDITRSGRFIVTCNSRNMASDSSTIMGFWRDSAVSVWRYKVAQTTAGGPWIQGIRISGNDSLVIVNTYGGFYVFRTYTGQLIYSGPINPSSSSGTQMPQGISGNGNIIATINYSGFVRVFQWNGTTYNLLWQHQEPPGMYYNWMSAVDVSYDGSMVAVGTLNFITSSSYDGKVKLFRVATGSTPVWTYSGFGDEASGVAFSKGGNILAAVSWGNYSNPSVNNLLVFKISTNGNVPIFQSTSSGSFFSVAASDDGSTVFASGKRVHARQFGNGGQVYNVFIDTNDVVGISGNTGNVPDKFTLYQNYPNPFNAGTKIKFSIPPVETGLRPVSTRLIIYDVLGREVAMLVNEKMKPGIYEVDWNAANYPSGVYYYKLTAAEFTQTKKMVLMK